MLPEFLIPTFMPNTKLATLRYQALDRCFSDRAKYYYIEDLVEAVNRTLENNDQPRVSKRTVQYDIRDMESNHDWNVVFATPCYNGGRRFYRYADPNYSIWKTDLNAQQLEQLKSLMLLLQQFHGLPQFERIQEIVGQLEEKYGFTLPSPQSVIAFDTNEEASGLEYLSPLFEAIISKQPLHITYEPYGKPSFESIVHPYFIKQYNNRWFLLGFTTDGIHNNIVNMPLDRIKSLKPAPVEFVENTFCDFGEYFEDFVGVTKTNEEIKNIVLRIEQKRLPYVLSKPLHPSQRNHRASEGIIELKVIPNKELYQLLLAYGPDLEVLEPADVRLKMAEFAEKMTEKYREE